jgi:hypothetical protein
MQSDNIAKLVTALVKVQGNLRGYREDSENPFFKSKYGDLSSVWAAVRELLSGNGLCVIQTMEGCEDGRQKLRTVLAHESGEWIDSVMLRLKMMTATALRERRNQSLLPRRNLFPSQTPNKKQTLKHLCSSRNCPLT